MTIFAEIPFEIGDSVYVPVEGSKEITIPCTLCEGVGYLFTKSSVELKCTKCHGRGTISSYISAMVPEKQTITEVTVSDDNSITIQMGGIGYDYQNYEYGLENIYPSFELCEAYCERRMNKYE